MLVNSSHIATNSPCVGAGSISYTSGVDIDGEAWKNPPSMGCDEVYANALTGSLTVAVSANETNTYFGRPLTFSAVIEGRQSLNIWTFGDGTAETNKIEVSHSWSEVGEYDVVVTAFNETYPGGISDSISITVATNVHYVNIDNLSPSQPYLSWETAATNIQDAVDAAFNGGIIVVTNGTYLLTSVFVWLTYRINVEVDYKWNWSILPQYLIRFDHEKSRWVWGLIMQGVFTTLRLSIWATILAMIFGTIMGLFRVIVKPEIFIS